MKLRRMGSGRVSSGGLVCWLVACIISTGVSPVLSTFFFSDGFDSIRVYTPCGVSGNYSRVGFSGRLASFPAADPSFTGTLVAYDDCYFAVTDFNYPAKGAGISFWSNSQPSMNFSYAAPISPELIDIKTWAGADTAIVYVAGGGLTWEDIGVIYVVCNTCSDVIGPSSIVASIIIGDVPAASAGSASIKQLRQAVQAEAKALKIQAAPPPPSPSPPPPAKGNASSTGPAAGFRNCIQGYPDRLNIYWTVVKKGDDYSVNYGLEARVGDNSWAGFGFSGNQAKAQALFSDVTITGIISSDPTGFAKDFYITSQQVCAESRAGSGNISGVCQDNVLGSAQDLNNVKLTSATRKADVSFVTYSKAAKTVDTSFDVDLTSSPTIYGNWYVVYAAGPLAPASTNENPIPLNHDESLGYFKGGTRISLNPSAEPVFSCTPLYGSKAKYHPPLPPYVAPPPAGPPPPPADASGLAKLSTCVATFQGKTERFATCSILPGGLTFMWSLDGSAMTAVFIAQLQKVTNWVAVGISPDGAAAGSSLLAAYGDGNGSVAIGQYFVTPAGAKASQRVVAGGNLSVTSAQAELSNNIVTALFTVQLPEKQLSAAYLVWSKGSSGNGSQLSQDGIKAIQTSAISFQSGATTGAANTGSLAWGVHGVINAVAWGVILPLGGFVGRYVRRVSPFWFPFHRGIQLLGYWLGQVGFVTGLTMARRGAQPAHLGLGILLFSLATLQVMAVVWRPEENSKWRELWRKYHLSLGLSLLLLAIIQIFVGLHIAGASQVYVIIYIVWLAFLVVVVVGLEVQPYVPGLRNVHLFSAQLDPGVEGIDKERWDSGYLGWTPEKGGDSGIIGWAPGSSGPQVAPEGPPREDGSARALALWEHLKTQVGDPDLPPPFVEKRPEKSRLSKFLSSGEKRLEKQSGELGGTGKQTSGPLGERREDVETGVNESGQAKYLRMSSANEVVDRRSGELGLFGEIGLVSSELPTAGRPPAGSKVSGEHARSIPSPPPPRPRVPSPGKPKPLQRSSSLSGPLGEAMRKFAMLPRREPIIKTDKYNVKATIVKPPDLNSFRRAFEKAQATRLRAPPMGAGSPGETGLSSSAGSDGASGSGGPRILRTPSSKILGGMELGSLEVGLAGRPAGMWASGVMDPSPGGIGSPIELAPIKEGPALAEGSDAGSGPREEKVEGPPMIKVERILGGSGILTPLNKPLFAEEPLYRSPQGANPFADPAEGTSADGASQSRSHPRRNLEYYKKSGAGSRPITPLGAPLQSPSPLSGGREPFSQPDTTHLSSSMYKPVAAPPPSAPPTHPVPVPTIPPPPSPEGSRPGTPPIS